jgi:uncharacterized protein YceH (UPF0502 family)
MMEHINAWLPTVVAGGAIALLWNDIRNFKKLILDQTQELAKSTEEKARALAKETSEKADQVAKEMRHSLFRIDGETVYMPRGACEREQSRCQTLTCGKIDGLAAKLDDMNSKREAAKEAQANQMGDIKQGLALLNEQVEQLLDKK